MLPALLLLPALQKSEKYTEEKEYKDDDWFGKDGDKKDKYEEYAADDKEDF